MSFSCVNAFLLLRIYAFICFLQHRRRQKDGDDGKTLDTHFLTAFMHACSPTFTDYDKNS